MAHSRTEQDGRQERVCCLQETHACPSVFDSRTMSAYHCPAVVASLIILEQEEHSVTLNAERKRLPGYRGNGPEEIFKDTVLPSVSRFFSFSFRLSFSFFKYVMLTGGMSSDLFLFFLLSQYSSF